MNKWIQKGMIGLALSSATIASMGKGQGGFKSSNSDDKLNSFVSVDATEFDGGSKLKDRSMDLIGVEVELVHATVQI